MPASSESLFTDIPIYSCLARLGRLGTEIKRNMKSRKPEHTKGARAFCPLLPLTLTRISHVSNHSQNLTP
jgi:hypothetical protein